MPLGSIVAISNTIGNIIERRSYDAWGKRRNLNGTMASNAFVTSNVRHAFTGHEDLGEVGLIHMNGRIYDPAIGRFMSADPTIQYADDMQNYNRYSYINNNPLAAVDYSGYGWNPFKSVGKLFKKLAKALKSVLKNKFLRIAASIAISAYGPGFIGSTNLFGGALYDYADIIAGGIAGFAGSGGSVKAAIQGAVSGGLFKWAGGVGAATGEYGVAHYAAHAAAGCASALAGGGDCGRGALSAVAGKAGTWASDGNMAMAVIAGGTASKLSGGKFANGAVTSAFGVMYNCGLPCLGYIAQIGSRLAPLWTRLQTLWIQYGPQTTAIVAEIGGVNGTLSSASVLAREVRLIDGFYQAEGSAFKFSKYYYEKLWSTGRGAPFLQAEEMVQTVKTISLDTKPGFYRYTNETYEMVYNPATKEVWHLQPLKN